MHQFISLALLLYEISFHCWGITCTHVCSSSESEHSPSGRDDGEHAGMLKIPHLASSMNPFLKQPHYGELVSAVYSIRASL